jgi:hypothetical protein
MIRRSQSASVSLPHEYPLIQSKLNLCVCVVCVVCVCVENSSNGKQKWRRTS